MKLEFSTRAVSPKKLKLPALTVKSCGEITYKPRFSLNEGELIVEFGHWWGFGSYYAETVLETKNYGLCLYGGDNTLESLIEEEEMAKVIKYLKKYGKKIVKQLKVIGE